MVFRAALEKAFSENPQVLKNLSRALEYTEFEPFIGIGLSKLDWENLDLAVEGMSSRDKEEIRAALMKWRVRADNHGVVRLSMTSFSFEEMDSLTFAALAKYDDFLYRTKTTSRIAYFLYRNGQPIPLEEACSGEIAFITSVAFISAHIGPKTVIAIDEPDTSLHPTWQQSYVRTLLDLFHLYQPSIVLSTHSPIIVSGTEAAHGKLSVYEVRNGAARRFDHLGLSLEEMYDRLFGLITPKNHYLSQRAVSLLNSLSDENQSLDDVLRDLGALKSKSYEESQIEVIAKFESLARKLDRLRNGRQL